MKGLILSGGKGTRLRPLTYTGAKQLVPVANQPILWFGIESLREAGITDIGIIVSPETGAEVQQITGTGERFGVHITYITQPQPAGLADAVRVAQPFLGRDPFVMYLGDNLIANPLGDLCQQFVEQQSAALVLLKEVTNPHAFGVAELDAAGALIRLVEKPLHPPSNLALVGVYLFTAAIHEAIAHIVPSSRGELEITDAIQWLLDQGYAVAHSRLQGWWLDTGKKDDLLAANQIILDDRAIASMAGEVDHDSHIVGRVQIGVGTTIENCQIRGPVVIGEHCQIAHSFIGPYTSIGDHTQIQGVDIEHSVVLAGAKIISIPQRIVDSIIGRRALLQRSSRPPKALRLMLGDDCQVDISTGP